METTTHRAGELLKECLRRGLLAIEDIAALVGHDPEQDDLTVEIDGDAVTITSGP